MSFYVSTGTCSSMEHCVVWTQNLGNAWELLSNQICVKLIFKEKALACVVHKFKDFHLLQRTSLYEAGSM